MLAIPFSLPVLSLQPGRGRRITGIKMAAVLQGTATGLFAGLQSVAYLSHDSVLSCACTSLGMKATSCNKKQLKTPYAGASLKHLLVSASPLNVCDNRAVQCNSSMSFNNNRTGEGFSENEEDYVNSTVVEAVEVKSGAEGFLIKMKDGRYLKCVHNNPGSHLPDYAPQPAIVLKMEDNSNLLLPIIVLELPSSMLMDAVRNVPVARPTVYEVMKEMIDLMGFQPKVVRVTKRVHEAYFARLYLSKVGDETDMMFSLDLRPSDAINIAVRSKVPIQVNRQLAYGDGVRIVNEAPALPLRILRTSSKLLDSTEADSSLAAEEFVLVCSMLMAASEERYIDAAHIRDQLNALRSKKDRQQQA
ncbi:hypothetical protein O6H91_04G118500 [Diphasiastrum complanatum]|uniref:Uncharacterized protein n=7 Tax=Diphasiastrum complanatum TaxID=34168 RepID=A0ACC2E0Z0_DIPCM|nr:hypothetical protein O6H91_04G118500 [Diphasiastrum complanatum]KAJ7560207.1 hypothetical protein O6H91_04G118500 [Diphasiastrum complanatum]KAJ7560208.1 hypothetical protein O6H91_04G118500 [Diphasiastrum complanatum]KAJ7560210.1 hypothetical protein O6H91_04G118500 [Diphasiastrum complanatum]KAJ7560211.1 hypothetical protein O6H91_04G118500 [Diphasiastrum complanatum]